MAEYHRIEYRISKDGTVTETVIGGSGPSCTVATQAMEQALGQVQDQTLLPEYEVGDDDVTVYGIVQSTSQ